MEDGRRRLQRQQLLLASDFIISILWAWSGVLLSIFLHRILGCCYHQLYGEFVRHTASILNMFLFAFIASAANGAAHNPLTVLAFAISSDFQRFLFTVGARIPVQVVGSIYGVRLIQKTLPGVVHGPKLNVNIVKGAMTEGVLTFGIVMISLVLSMNGRRSFFMNTWISSVLKLALHVLGADLTGGCMNPASVMGWAFARGEHVTKEHLVVYWLAPVVATLIAVWFFNTLVKPKRGSTALKAKLKKSE